MKYSRIVLTSILATMQVVYSAQASLAAGQSLSRDKALEGLKSCGTLSAQGCNEEASETLIGFYKSGDKALLKPLLDAGLVSDGALSESLGAFYADLLYREPRVFLTALASRSKKSQHHLARLAALADGSGMPKEVLRDVKITLGKIAAQRNSRLSSVARLCLSEVNKANRAVR